MKKKLTDDGNGSNNTGKKAPGKSAAPDPRVLAFVRMLARNAADRDYARFLERHRKAHKPPATEE